jgi:hypothetical protein
MIEQLSYRSVAWIGLIVATFAGAALWPWAAVAGESAVLTRQIAETGNWHDGERSLSQRLNAAPSDDEARFGLGMIRFVAAVEAFGQHHYRFGLRTPASAAMVPFLRMPVPLNPNPELLTYDLQRSALRAFLEALADVDTTLADIRDKDLKIVIDLEKTRLDFRGSGRADPSATLMSVVRSVAPTAAPRGASQSFEVAFDLGDAIWLRGYCHLLSAALEFLLAYDWHETFTLAGGLFYPRIDGAPPLPWGASQRIMMDDVEIASVVAMIHSIHWEPAEPARLAKARAHLKEVVALSRASWKAILDETDDDREWIPAPRQKDGVLPGMTVTQARLDTWLAALDDFDAVLDGRLLLPHWALAKGINLKRVFEEPRRFDLVLWVTGHAAAPYLENGPVMPAERWRLWENVFEGNFLGFAAYFN